MVWCTECGGGDFAHGQREGWGEAESDSCGTAPLDGHLGLTASAQRLIFRGPWSLGNLNLVDYFHTGSQAF